MVVEVFVGKLEDGGMRSEVSDELDDSRNKDIETGEIEK